MLHTLEMVGKLIMFGVVIWVILMVAEIWRIVKGIESQTLNAPEQRNEPAVDIQAAVSCDNCQDNPETEVCASCGRTKSPLS